MRDDGGMSPAPGWYQDPQDLESIRYFDGQAWTNQTAPAGGAGAPQAPAQPPSAAPAAATVAAPQPAGPGASASVGSALQNPQLPMALVITAAVVAVLTLLYELLAFIDFIDSSGGRTFRGFLAILSGAADGFGLALVLVGVAALLRRSALLLEPLGRQGTEQADEDPEEQQLLHRSGRSAPPARPCNVCVGGVRAPGGLRRLQSGWDERSSSGGFDSRPPPPEGLAHPPATVVRHGEERARDRARAVLARPADRLLPERAAATPAPRTSASTPCAPR